MNKNTILIYAFRYALGRRTYAVSDVVEALIENWDSLDKYSKELIKKEIKLHEKCYGNLGMECDKEQWYKILELE